MLSIFIITSILTPIYTSNQVRIEELFRTLSKTNQFDNIPKPPNVIMKNLSINLDKLNFTTIVSKIKGFSFNITAEDDVKDTRRLAWIGSRSQWKQGSKLLVQNKLYDLMLQLIYMARHKIKQVENEAYYNPADTSYRIAFLYRRLRRIWKKMLDIYTTMIKKQDAGGVFMTVNPFLILHHKAVKLHVDFVYLWWVLVKLHERYDYRHGIFISTPPNFNKN